MVIDVTRVTHVMLTRWECKLGGEVKWSHVTQCAKSHTATTRGVKTRRL
jgi:hypothetical protein